MRSDTCARATTTRAGAAAAAANVAKGGARVATPTIGAEQVAVEQARRTGAEQARQRNGAGTFHLEQARNSALNRPSNRFMLERREQAPEQAAHRRRAGRGATAGGPIGSVVLPSVADDAACR